MYRIIIQAAPPFLVVHTNAAYTRLTGTDSHTVVGKTIGSILSVPENAEPLPRAGETEQADATAAAPPPPPLPAAADAKEGSETRERDLVAAEAAGIARAEASRRESMRDAKIERLVVASGFGHIQYVQALAQPNPLPSGGRNNVPIHDETAGKESSRDEGSNNTSISSCFEGTSRLISCRTSIAPIVSTHDTVSFMNEKDAELDHKSKRHKHPENPETENTNPKKSKPGVKEIMNPPHRIRGHNQGRQLVTHYVIQLVPHDLLFRFARPYVPRQTKG